MKEQNRKCSDDRKLYGRKKSKKAITSYELPQNIKKCKKQWTKDFHCDTINVK
jgi:hypothetical protein